ncbi:hypothetical protein BN977_04994 [Mycolicibacterium cosmeticum]|uniref:Uncharacterized protein n=1 Tax=Mycolicibacterium cosmeticum TaxID=258533 RepID=W9AWH9_MYCCO|nr:hypothetical protein BN977_04994 [Mycolicibacterium cosmeticum]
MAAAGRALWPRRIGWAGRSLRAVEPARRGGRVDTVRGRRPDQGIGHRAGPDLRHIGDPLPAREVSHPVELRRAAAPLADFTELGQATLFQYPAGHVQALGHAAGLRERPARHEQRPDIECRLTRAPARVVTLPLVQRDELLAHFGQHTGCFAGIVRHFPSLFGHALPHSRIGHRHDTGHGVDQTVGYTHLEVGVQGDGVGQEIADVVAELSDQNGPDPLLEGVSGIADHFLEFVEQADDALDLALEIAQHGTDVASDLAEHLHAIAGEEVGHRVPQPRQRQPVQ